MRDPAIDIDFQKLNQKLKVKVIDR
jgi:hypothetical protein